MPKQPDVEFVPVYKVCGHLAGEMVRLLLESVDIPAIVRQESAGIAIGLTVGSLGIANICVPENRVEEALQILQAMDNGELDEIQETTPEQETGDGATEDLE